MPITRRVVDALVADVGDMEQAVDAAEIDEGAVVGDVLDHALDHLALGQRLDEAVRCSARVSSRMARRETTILPRRRSILRIWKGWGCPSAGDVADRADVDLADLEGRRRRRPDRR
jgi:hypothetical protein